MTLCPIVPSPDLRIEVTPVTLGPHYAGSGLNLTCVAVLSPAVDIEVSLISYWEAPVVISSNSTRVLEHEVVGANGTYRSGLQFLTLSQSRDSGVYTCSIAIVPVGSPVVIQSSITATLTTIDIASMLHIHVQLLKACCVSHF